MKQIKCGNCRGMGENTVVTSYATQAYSESRGTYIQDEQSHQEKCRWCKGTGVITKQ